MLATLKPYLLLAGFLMLVLAGWIVRGWHDKAAQDKADQAMLLAQQKNQQLSAQISQSYEAGKQAALPQQLTSTLTLSKPYAPYNACGVRPADVLVLKAAVSYANNPQ